MHHLNHFINNASSVEEAFSNVKFQFDNVDGWLTMPDYECALIKANCMKESLELLISILETKTKKP
jgi:hypothetical protein